MVTNVHRKSGKREHHIQLDAIMDQERVNRIIGKVYTGNAKDCSSY